MAETLGKEQEYWPFITKII